MVHVPDFIVLCTSLLFSVSLLAALYWFPWHGDEQELSRLEAYRVGTPVGVGVPVLTMLRVTTLARSYPPPFWAALRLANTAVGGLTVGGLTVGGACWHASKWPIARKDADDATRRR